MRNLNTSGHFSTPLLLLLYSNEGANQETVTPPLAALGTYTLTAVGGTSKLQASANLAISPGLLIQPYAVTPGGTMNITGGGFTPNETVNVYIPQGGIYNGYTDSTGSFIVTATAPLGSHPKISYPIYADSTSGMDKAKAQYAYVTPQLGWANLYNNSYVPYGTPFTVSSQGFFPEEHVALYWNYQQLSQTNLGNISADSQGNVSTSITAPASLMKGRIYTIALIGGSGASPVHANFKAS